MLSYYMFIIIVILFIFKNLFPSDKQKKIKFLQNQTGLKTFEKLSLFSFFVGYQCDFHYTYRLQLQLNADNCFFFLSICVNIEHLF